MYYLFIKKKKKKNVLSNSKYIAWRIHQVCSIWKNYQKPVSLMSIYCQPSNLLVLMMRRRTGSTWVRLFQAQPLSLKLFLILPQNRKVFYGDEQMLWHTDVVFEIVYCHNFNWYNGSVLAKSILLAPSKELVVHFFGTHW